MEQSRTFGITEVTDLCSTNQDWNESCSREREAVRLKTVEVSNLQQKLVDIFGATNPHGTKSTTSGKWVGEMKDGKANGYGTWTNDNGSICVGEFKDDKFHGIGTKTFVDGIREKYSGEWENNKQHGQGTMQYVNGPSWTGEWVNGEKQE